MTIFGDSVRAVGCDATLFTTTAMMHPMALLRSCPCALGLRAVTKRDRDWLVADVIIVENLWRALQEEMIMG